MTEVEKMVELIDSIHNEKTRKMVCRMVMAMINGTDRDRDEIYKIAMSGAGFNSMIPIIERIEAG